MNRTCPFTDDSLICFKDFEPKNLSLARVETKTFIKLLYEYMVAKERDSSNEEVSNFFQSYDEAMMKIAKVDSTIKDPKRFLAQTSHMDEAEMLEYQAHILTELGRHEESIRVMLDELLRNLYDATIQSNNSLFIKLITEATNELNAKVTRMYEMIS